LLLNFCSDCLAVIVVVCVSQLVTHKTWGFISLVFIALTESPTVWRGDGTEMMGQYRDDVSNSSARLLDLKSECIRQQGHVGNKTLLQQNPF